MIPYYVGQEVDPIPQEIIRFHDHDVMVLISKINELSATVNCLRNMLLNLQEEQWFIDLRGNNKMEKTDECIHHLSEKVDLLKRIVNAPKIEGTNLFWLDEKER